MKKIIVTTNFTFLQGVLIFLVFTLFFVLGVYILSVNFTIKHFLIGTILLFLSLFFLILLFVKKGLLLVDDTIYKVQYLFSKIVYRYEISLKGITDISILLFKGHRSLNSFSVYPKNALLSEGEFSVETYDIYLLNQKHTIKHFLIAIKNKKLAEKIVNEIADYHNLRYKLYSPRFNH